jgi:hypothetical protein
MRSKKDIQQELDRIKHKEQKKNRRAAADNDERQVAIKPPNPSMLLVCEGRNTEPSYFNEFKRANVTVRKATVTIQGDGGDPSNIVALAKRLDEQAKAAGEPYEQVWCVFDRDDHKHFSSALEDVRQAGFRAAWSNQSFEYWLLLHFEAHAGGGLHRDGYKERLNHYLEPLRLVYDAPGLPSKTVTTELFLLMESFEKGKSRQEWAIDRARRIHSEKAGISPADAESCTTVYELVEQLRSLI